MERPKNQYCRYCANTLDYNGECTDFICTAKAPCGDDGAGRFYKAVKAKRPNKCKHLQIELLGSRKPLLKNYKIRFLFIKSR